MIAKLVGCFVIVAVTGLVGAFIYHFISKESISWWLVGPVAGYWIARPYFFAKTIERKELIDAEVQENWRHPFPREYALPLPEAFAAIRQVFEKAVFNLSDKWHIKADTFQKKIVAQIHINEETDEKRPTRKFLEAEIYFHDTEQDTTIVEIHFAERPEGKLLFGFDPIDRYVEETMSAIAEKLGIGTLTNPERLKEQKVILHHDIKFRRTPAPSLALISVSVLSLVLVPFDVFLAAFKHSTEPRQTNEQALRLYSPEHHVAVTLVEWGRQKTFDVTVHSGESEKEAIENFKRDEVQKYIQEQQLRR